MNRLQRWWKQRFLRKQRIPLHLWERCLSQSPLLLRLDRHEKHRLRELAGWFLHEKSIVGAHDFVVNDEMRVLIAAQACLLILNLDFGYFKGWYEVIVYPDAFIARHEQHDEAGVVHELERSLEGESWQQGPVILSWHEARPGVRFYGDGSNVILHEFAHKIDMLNGAANGLPPLHAEMSLPQWTDVMTKAYDDLRARLENNKHVVIDSYAAESPAEFFAVLSETFFERPQILHSSYPEVYELLRQFYRQDAFRRISHS
jgi:Mlc titration factor MtfA (ptsG expression regulator)